MGFWDDAVNYAAHAMNITFIRHTPFTGEKLTAYEHIYGHPPDRRHWFIFGSDATIFIPVEDRGNQQKLQSRAVEGIYLGLAPFRSGALFFVPESGKYVSAVKYDLRQGVFQVAHNISKDVNILAEPIWHILIPDDFEQSSLQEPALETFPTNLPDLSATHSSFQFPRDENEMEYEFINQDARDFNTHEQARLPVSVETDLNTNPGKNVDMTQAAPHSIVEPKKADSLVLDPVIPSVTESVIPSENLLDHSEISLNPGAQHPIAVPEMADSHVKDLIEPSVVNSVVPSDILLDHGEKPTGPVARQFKPFEHTSQPVSVNAPQLSPSDAGIQTASPIAPVSVDTSASSVVIRPVGMKPHESRRNRRGRPRKVSPTSDPTPAPTPVESVTLDLPLENPDVGGGNTAVDLEEHTSTQNPDVLEEPRVATQADDVVELILKKDRDSEAVDLKKSTSTQIPEVLPEPEIVNTAAEVLHEPVVVLNTPDVLEEPRAANRADKSVEPILKKYGDSEEHEIDEDLLRRFQELVRETYKKAQLFGRVSEFNKPDFDLPTIFVNLPT